MSLIVNTLNQMTYEIYNFNHNDYYVIFRFIFPIDKKKNGNGYGSK